MEKFSFNKYGKKVNLFAYLSRVNNGKVFITRSFIKELVERDFINNSSINLDHINDVNRLGYAVVEEKEGYLVILNSGICGDISAYSEHTTTIRNIYDIPVISSVNDVYRLVDLYVHINNGTKPDFKVLHMQYTKTLVPNLEP